MRVVRDGDKPWPFADGLAIVRYLLTGRVNGNDPEAIGAALYEIGLVPDFELLAQPERAPGRAFRNRDCVARITWSSRSERGRALDLGLSNPAFRKQLGDFLASSGIEDPRLWTRAIVFDRANWPLAFNKWEFEDGGASPDSVFIGNVVVELSIFEDADDELGLAELSGQKVLVPGPARFPQIQRDIPSRSSPVKSAGATAICCSGSLARKRSDRPCATKDCLEAPHRLRAGYLLIDCQSRMGGRVVLRSGSRRGGRWGVGAAAK